jgi:WD40 repeat protein
MRLFRVLTVMLFLAACGAPEPQPAARGPRLQASMAASWPAAAPARQAVFSRDGRLLATSDASGLITLRTTADRKIVEQFHHPVGATSLAFGPDGTRLYSGGYDGTVRDWNLRSRGLAQTFNGPRGTVWTIDVSPDGKRLAAAGEDKLIRIWTLGQSRPPMLLRGHTLNIWDIHFSPDGKRLASGSFDHLVKLWDVGSGKLLKTLAGHQEAVVGLDYSPDGKLLATGGDDSTARFWRASDGAPLRTIDNGRHVDKVAISPDGKWLATGGHARGAVGTLWHEVTGGGGDGEAVRLWRINDGAMVAALPHPDDVIFVAFSRDGRWLVTSGEDRRFRLWSLRAR